MKNMDLLRENILKEIKELGYESLRYSVFNEHGLSEWETRIEFNNETEKYEVYLTRDRAGKGKIFEYTNFKRSKRKIYGVIRTYCFKKQVLYFQWLGSSISISPLG